ncbi:MAG: DoxX family protein [Armatimonadetes bacterium]|nr:DoxX family protein [Armatimonadota bacterium]
MPTFDALLTAQVFALTFFAIAFIQSGLDKVFDWTGNLGWLSGHFGKSPLRGIVRPMLGVLTVMELLTGGACAVAVVAVIAGWAHGVAYWALTLVLLTLTSLFFGQRVAKDYAGAAVIAAYFAVALIGLYLLSIRPA